MAIARGEMLRAKWIRIRLMIRFARMLIPVWFLSLVSHLRSL